MKSAAQRTHFPSQVCCAAWVCSFEFKILRLIRVLSAQIAAAVTTAYIDAHNIFALVIQFLTSFHTIYVILLTFVTVFGKLQTVVRQISPTGAQRRPSVRRPFSLE